MKDSIFVITNQDMTQGMQKLLRGYMRAAKLPTFSVHFDCAMTKGMGIKKGKTKWIADPDKRELFLSKLSAAIRLHEPKVIIINDWMALSYITTKHSSLAVTRGSVYYVNNIPAIVIDNLRTKDRGLKLKAVKHASWLLRLDLQKVARWYSGKPHREPKFDLTIVDRPEQFWTFECDAREALLMSLDIETTGWGLDALITCSGYAFLMPNGSIKIYVIPFLNPFAKDGVQWNEKEFVALIKTIRSVHDLPCPKVMQNGSYDSTYFIRYRLPLRNWIFDTAVFWHSIWPESPKKLDFMSSIVCDHYRYWKDEATEDAKDDKHARLPRTKEGWQKYLRYNGFDVYYPIFILMYVLNITTKIPWVMENYRKTMRQTLGPGLAMSARGLRVNKDIQRAWERDNQFESNKARNILLKMVGDAEFNPNSPKQVATLIYDVLQAQPLPKRDATNKGRSTNENDLELIRTQHWLLDKIISQIWKVKKPANNVSKYGTFGKRETGAGKMTWNGMRTIANRWTYKLSASGTIFGRYSSSKSNLWVGQQIQNPPYEARAMVEPDPGYILWRVDLSKADMWHTAFAAEEPEMMRVLLEEAAGKLDVHCYHAAKFYQKPYDEIYAGYKAKEEWVVHSTKGCRQNTKRISYGANYLMAGFTLLLQMGLDAVRATANAMGHNTDKWVINDYKIFCQNLINFYFSNMYPGLLPWIARRTNYVSRHGKMETCNGNRTVTFFADPASDKAAQRQLASFYGQGGSAGTVNKALDKFYYEGYDSSECMCLWQLHDEIGGQVRQDSLHLVSHVVDLLTEPNTYNGQTYVIPAEAEVGLGWGYRMCDWHPNVQMEELVAADAKWKEKNKAWL